MSEKYEIVEVKGREILDARGLPALEAEVVLGGGAVGRAAVSLDFPADRSERPELRDGSLRYHGMGVKYEAEYISTVLAEAITFENVLNQRNIDRILKNIDGNSKLGIAENGVILSVSAAAAKAAANGVGFPLYRYLGGAYRGRMPVPMMRMLAGKSSVSTIDLKEFLMIPTGTRSFSEELQMGTEIFHTLKKLLETNRCPMKPEGRGGFSAGLKNVEEALDYLVDAVSLSGYKPGREVNLGINAAADELYDEATGMYLFPGEGKTKGMCVERTSEEMVDYYRRLTSGFPVIYIEDGLQRNDWEGRQLLSKALGHKIQLADSQFFAADKKYFIKDAEKKMANSVVVNVNHMGTVTDSMDFIETIRRAGYTAVISHGGGETEDSFLADLAVAANCCQIKTGAPLGSEYTAKYNQLLRIEEELK